MYQTEVKEQYKKFAGLGPVYNKTVLGSVDPSVILLTVVLQSTTWIIHNLWHPKSYGLHFVLKNADQPNVFHYHRIYLN